MTCDQPATSHRNGLLFLCAGTGARSLMAEAFARYIGPTNLAYHSAGVTTAGSIHPHALKVMREVGLDISQQPLRILAEISFDTVATVVSLCAGDVCPPLPAGVHHLSWPLPDPTEPGADTSEPLQPFREVRDQIRELVSRLF